MRKAIFVLLALSVSIAAFATKAPTAFNDVLIGNSAKIGGSGFADSKSLLDLTSTSKGFLLPRMTATQRDAISAPPTGLQIYNTSAGAINIYDGAAWTSVGGIASITQPDVDTWVFTGVNDVLAMTFATAYPALTEVDIAPAAQTNTTVPGADLNIYGGDSAGGSTNKQGGNLLLFGGRSTGSAHSYVIIGYDGSATGLTINNTGTHTQDDLYIGGVVRDASTYKAADFSNRTLHDAGETISVDFKNRYLYDSGGNLLVNYDTGHIYDQHGAETISWRNSILKAAGNDSVDWANRQLNDSTNTRSIDWQNRIIKSSGGGTALDWSSLAAGSSGDCLTNAGSSVAAWGACVALAAVGSSPSANGASISGNTLTLQPADATHPGLMTTGTQTIAGAKTFSGGITATVTGNASTATALAANPTACGAGDFVTDIDADGTLHCGTPAGGSAKIAKVAKTSFTPGGSGNTQITFTSSDAVTGSDNTMIGTNSFIAPATGWYQVAGHFYLDRDINSYYLLYYEINGGSQFFFGGDANMQASGGAYPRDGTAVDIYLTASDAVTLWVLHDGSGGDSSSNFAFSFQQLH